MRLLHVVPTYLPATRYGGPIYSVHGLCSALARRPHDVHVFTTNVDGAGSSNVPLSRPVDVDGVKVWYFPSSHLRRLYFAPSMARSLAQHVASFDMVHLHSVFLWPTWAASRVASRLGVPYLLSPRGMLVKNLIRRKSRWLKTMWITLIERRNLERAAAVHATSAIEATEIRAFGFALPRLTTIPNGISLPSGRAGGQTSPDVESIAARPDLILFLGRISWKKGLDRLIPALAEVPGAHLAIVGNDDEELVPQLERMVERCGVKDRVGFLPRFVDGADKQRLFSAAKVCVLPSYSENFGNTVLEAMAQGCPVVVTPEVGTAEIVQACGGGRVVPGDPHLLGRALREILADPLRNEIGARGRRYVAEHLSWDAIAERMEREYLAILAQRRSAKADVR